MTDNELKALDDLAKRIGGTEAQLITKAREELAAGHGRLATCSIHGCTDHATCFSTPRGYTCFAHR